MSKNKKFAPFAAFEANPKWQQMISRLRPLYSRSNDFRTHFGRDYTRILHCTAYRRLKHKTQVFFSPQSDHICTRIEHVNHVESVSYTIVNYLGLNTELTKAISVGHDIGHAPFGHEGERILSEISQKEIGQPFCHELNGLFFADNIELLEDKEQNKQNLNLTYAVRDGIVSHCGESDSKSIKPRQQAIDLSDYIKPSQFEPFTWEGCVVKLADRISYLGRDIEDALAIGILEREKLCELSDVLNSSKKEALNNTVIINSLISDLCQNSSPEKGLCFSNDGYRLLKTVKDFNYRYIYNNQRIINSKKYFSLIINEIYQILKNTYNKSSTPLELKKLEKYYPSLAGNFLKWISNYWDLTDRKNTSLKNAVIFNVSDSETDYRRAVLCYISGMTDKFAIDTYNEIISF